MFVYQKGGYGLYFTLQKKNLKGVTVDAEEI